MAKRILVIDDDRLMRSGCSRILSKEGWSVICAENGDQGLKEIRNRPDSIDVILVDQMMPGMSGMEVLEQIQTIDPNLPVIFMSGSATAESALEAVQKGAYDCIPKPFTPDEIREVVRRATSKIKT